MGKLLMIRGDFIEYCKFAEIDVAVHNCNCFNVMGAGIALSLSREFPAVLEADLRTLKGSKSKLGSFSVSSVTRRDDSVLQIYNIYGQYRYSRETECFELDAFISGLRKVISKYDSPRVLMPYVGCGLGKGNVNELLHALGELVNEVECTIYLVEYVQNIRKVIVAGSRGYTHKRDNTYNFIRRTLDEEYLKEEFIVVSGKANGPDEAGYKWSERNSRLSLNFPAMWRHKGSGYIRNAIMGTVATDAMVFWDGSSTGSQHMIKYMQSKNKPVKVIGDN